jgi:hypothetical protein
MKIFAHTEADEIAASFAQALIDEVRQGRPAADLVDSMTDGPDVIGWAVFDSLVEAVERRARHEGA